MGGHLAKRLDVSTHQRHPEPNAAQPQPCSGHILLPYSCCGGIHNESSGGAAVAGSALGQTQRTIEQLGLKGPS